MNENDLATLNDQLNQIVKKLTIGTFPWTPKELIRLLQVEKIYTEKEAAFIENEWNNVVALRKTTPSTIRFIVRPESRRIYQTVTENFNTITFKINKFSHFYIEIYCVATISYK